MNNERAFEHIQYTLIYRERYPSTYVDRVEHLIKYSNEVIDEVSFFVRYFFVDDLRGDCYRMLEILVCAIEKNSQL